MYTHVVKSDAFLISLWVKCTCGITDKLGLISQRLVQNFLERNQLVIEPGVAHISNYTAIHCFVTHTHTHTHRSLLLKYVQRHTHTHIMFCTSFSVAFLFCFDI